MNGFDLEKHGITVKDVRRNVAPAQLYADAIREDPNCVIADSGALIAYSGEKTGRSPKDKRVVKSPLSENEVWWGPVNIPIDERSFQINLERARDYLNLKRRLYCFDGFAGWDPENRARIRVICSRPYHALFMHIMLIRPTAEELASFGEPHAVIYNAASSRIFSARTFASMRAASAPRFATPARRCDLVPSQEPSGDPRRHSRPFARASR